MHTTSALMMFNEPGSCSMLCSYQPSAEQLPSIASSTQDRKCTSPPSWIGTSMQCNAMCADSRGVEDEQTLDAVLQHAVFKHAALQEEAIAATVQCPANGEHDSTWTGESGDADKAPMPAAAPSMAQVHNAAALARATRECIERLRGYTARVNGAWRAMQWLSGM